MKYLFIDASENKTHIQTGTENSFSAKTIDTNRNFAAKITEICDNMLNEAGWQQKDLTHLVVCTGPGSLTGLRVADGFLRALAMLLNIPLIGIDLFKWSTQSICDKGYEGEARLVMPTLIDKAFEVKIEISDLTTANDNLSSNTSLQTNSITSLRGFSRGNVAIQNRISITKPVLIDKKDIPSEIKTYGIRWSHEAAERLDPTPESLHKLIIEETKNSKSGIDEILKVLPLYIIPSQAERNFKGGDK